MTILPSKVWKMHLQIVVVDRCGLPHLGWLNTWLQPGRLPLPGLLLRPDQRVRGPGVVQTGTGGSWRQSDSPHSPHRHVPPFPHTTHFLFPLDTHCFRPMKQVFVKVFDGHMNSYKSDIGRFMEEFCEVYNKELTENNLRNGFADLRPWSPA